MDALKMFPGPIFELHISNVHRREEIYHHSLISKVATAVMMGLGPDGYATAVSAMVRLLEASVSKAARP
jgi:3-dehydroquinate dehydratase-2